MAMMIGLTGGIGSGKSTVAAELKKLGCSVIDADTVARDMMAPGQAAYKDVVKEFGKEILGKDNAVNRKALAAVVFSDARKLKRLNELTHPHIMKEIEKRAEALKKQSPKTPIVVNAALLIEVGHHRIMNKIIVVVADEYIRFDRVMKRDNLTLTEIKARDLSQMPLDKKKTYADFVIDNNGTMEATLKQVREAYRKLTA
ncbi:MAG: dephospho-CoA kinase [Deltaproteobacteria bacterium]|nr:dephospho-CoA kinase [Deltaproteobacteria bacterium]